MKVLFVTGIYPPDAGGPSLYVHRLSHEMARQGRRVRVLTLSDTVGREDDAGVDVIRLKRLRGVPVVIRSAVMLFHVLRHAPWADLVYDNGGPLDTSIPGICACVAARRPMITKITGDIPWEVLRYRKWIDDSLDVFQTKKYPLTYSLFRWTQRFVVRHVNHVITPGHYLKKLVVGWGAPDQKVTVIMNALDPPSESGGDEPAFELPAAQGLFTLCTVGRLVPHKMVKLIIEAVSELPDTRLVVIGDGYETPPPEQVFARERGCADRVIFTGRLPHSHVIQAMSQCDAFVLASEYEGLPHSVLEAFTVGIPVVITDVCGNPEVVENGVNGYLFPPRDRETLKTCIENLKNDPDLRARFVANSRARLDDFSWEKLYKHTMEIFDKVIAAKGRNR